MIGSATLLALALAAAHASPPGGATQACRLERGAVITAAGFGALAGDVIVDLSRARSVLADTPAQAAGLTGGQARAHLVLGGRDLGEADLAIAAVDAQTRAFDTNILAILGWDVLGRRPLDLDLRGGACRLSLDGGRRLRRGTIAWSLVGGAPAVRAAISDGLTSRAGLFALDTTQAPSAIADARPERAAGSDARFRLRALSLDGRLWEQVPAVPETGVAPGLSGRIGTAVLNGLELRFDPRRRLLRLAGPQRGAVSDRPCARSSDSWRRAGR